MDFGNRLRELRKQRNLSQMRLSDVSGIPQTTISDWEKSKYTPNVPQLRKIAKALEVSISELIQEAG